MRSWRSSAAYRIGLAWSAAFALGVAALGVIVYFAMDIAFTRQLDATVIDEADSLAGEYRTDGAGELASAIAEREASRSPARILYAVFAPDGRRIMGSLRTGRPPLGVHDIGFIDPNEGPDQARGYAIDLSPRERLVVAADREWIERTDQTVITVFGLGFAAICALGLAGGLLLGAYLRRRLTAISELAKTIIAGNIQHRMPVGAGRDEFDQLAITLNRMLDRIEGLVENLRQVSSDIAHDLRTPLSRLRNLLEAGLAIERDGKAARFEESIARVDDVLAMFAAILRIAEVESGETRRFFAPLDLSELLTGLAESYAPSLAEGGRTLLWSIEPGLTTVGDRDLLAQATSNLLDNAERHSIANAVVRLTVSSTATRIYIAVVDNGPGVPASEWARIVGRFKRLESSRNTAGFGLGLNLVRAVAELHGGRLVFRDAEPGLSATIELPRSANIPPSDASGATE